MTEEELNNQLLLDDKRVRNARLLRAGEALNVKQSGKTAEFTIPQLREYEVAVFEA